MTIRIVQQPYSNRFVIGGWIRKASEIVRQAPDGYCKSVLRDTRYEEGDACVAPTKTCPASFRYHLDLFEFPVRKNGCAVPCPRQKTMRKPILAPKPGWEGGQM